MVVYNFEKGHVTKTTLLWGKIFIPRLGLAAVDPLAKLKQCSLINYRIIEGV